LSTKLSCCSSREGSVSLDKSEMLAREDARSPASGLPELRYP
jgi:hypothetical protein